MAWIVVGLDGVLVQSLSEEEGSQEGAVPGSPEAMQQLAADGHRLTVWTSRFAPMPEERKQQLRAQIEQTLASLGFPPMEVWTGTTRPDADIFLDRKAIPFDDDWPLALSHLNYELASQGLMPQQPAQAEPAEAAPQEEEV